MYKLDLPIDLRESAAIERRRIKEQQRQSRIFNARVRTIGVDLQSLEQQVGERKWMEDQERRRHEAFANDMAMNDRICVLLQKRQDQDVKALEKSTNEFRKEHQRPEDRREFDIYDPDGKKKDTPARVSDDDPRCGISSLQKFLGEDLNEKARKKLQQEQNREWFTSQMNERAQEDANRGQADRLHELKSIEMDQRAMDLARAEDECRDAVNMATKEYNLALARERKSKENADRQKELEDNLTEISNHVNGDMLTENPAVAQSAFGSHRVISDRWKGMSPTQVNDVLQTQHQQVEENMRKRDEANKQEEEWNENMLRNARAAVMMERQQERTRKELLRQQALENQRLAGEQKAKLDDINKNVYTNQPTAAYFMQFNTSSR
ncbi:RIB43A-like with coiled-coils protein 2 [Clytia hemisphaerica]|uniref:Uncharacterized protein n=1 Tax=Clytia hemisphaerica TaxID=252671 RepID=A0A7M5UIL9_9CNID